jgi:tetratricopeptide (TPR) repeat protein
MKRFLIATIIFSAFSTATAQSPAAKKIIRQLEQHPQQDTFRVNHLLRLTVDKSIPFTQIDSLESEALAISKKINYPHGIIASSLNLSIDKLSIGKTEEALDLLQKAYTLAKKEGEKLLEVKCLYQIAGIKNSTADSKQAIDYYLKAEDIAQGLPDKSTLANIQYTLGDEYLRLSYHVLRAKDKSFNAIMETDFDPPLEK